MPVAANRNNHPISVEDLIRPRPANTLSGFFDEYPMDELSVVQMHRLEIR